MIVQTLVLFVAAVLGGTLNAVAGGGSFITFPALVFTGVPAVPANATSTVALWPGSLASTAAYRRDMRPDRLTLVLAITSFVGGTIGAILLIHTKDSTFRVLVPWLLLAATALFIVNAPLTRWLRAHGRLMGENPSPRALIGITVAQFAIAVYGGFFGGGIGIMILAALGLMGLTNITMMNGLKTLLQSSINGVAVLTFVIAGAVFWQQAIVMLVGSIFGGYAGASVARKLDPQVIRRFVMVVGVVMTIYFFVKR